VRGDRDEARRGERPEHAEGGDLPGRRPKAGEADVEAPVEEDHDQGGRGDPLHFLDPERPVELREEVGGQGREDEQQGCGRDAKALRRHATHDREDDRSRADERDVVEGLERVECSERRHERHHDDRSGRGSPGTVLHFPNGALIPKTPRSPILEADMRSLAICGSVLALVLPALASAERARGSLAIVDGRGTIVVKGRGALLGRLDRGVLQITDLSPSDQWSPRVNGVPRGRLFTIRGRDISFYVPGGRYRVSIRGEGINVSARGAGVAVLDGQPDATGSTGTYAVGDDPAQPLPSEPTRVGFGSEPEAPQPRPLP